VKLSSTLFPGVPGDVAWSIMDSETCTVATASSILAEVKNLISKGCYVCGGCKYKLVSVGLIYGGANGS
jgi:hypothetical protein